MAPFIRMKAAIVLVTLCFGTWQAGNGMAYSTREGRVVVAAIDLDESLVVLEDPSAKVERAEYVTIQYVSWNGTTKTESYRIVDGAREFLTSIVTLKMPGLARLELGFYSAKGAARNIALLKALKLTGELSTKRWYDHAAFVKNGDEMVRISREEAKANPLFKGERKKDLSFLGERFIGPSSDLADAILFDDQRKYSAAGQEYNLLLIHDIDLDVKSSAAKDAEKWRAAGREDLARRFSNGFLKSRNKLVYAFGLFKRSLSEALRTDQALRDVVWKEQWRETEKGPVYRSEAREDIEFYREGTRAFKAANPSYKFTTLYAPVEAPCNSLFSNLSAI